MGKSWSSCKRNDPGTASSTQKYEMMPQEAPKETDEPVVPPAPLTTDDDCQSLADRCEEIHRRLNGTQPLLPGSDSKRAASIEAAILFDLTTNPFV